MDRLSSTTTIVRVALIGRAKERSTVLRCPVLHQKRAKKGLHVLRCSVFHQKYRWNSGVAKNFRRRGHNFHIFLIVFLFGLTTLKLIEQETLWGGLGECSPGIF